MYRCSVDCSKYAKYEHCSEPTYIGVNAPIPVTYLGRNPRNVQGGSG